MGEPESEKIIQVSFGEVFINHLTNFPTEDQKKIFDFASHITINGFSGLPGRVKQSTDVDKNDHKFLEKVRYARDNNLWHYHIGIPSYDESKPYGDWTSKYVLHYTHLGNDVIIVDMDSHPPFNLPAEHYLK